MRLDSLAATRVSVTTTPRKRGRERSWRPPVLAVYPVTTDDGSSLHADCVVYSSNNSRITSGENLIESTDDDVGMQAAKALSSRTDGKERASHAMQLPHDNLRCTCPCERAWYIALLPECTCDWHSYRSFSLACPRARERERKDASRERGREATGKKHRLSETERQQVRSDCSRGKGNHGLNRQTKEKRWESREQSGCKGDSERERQRVSKRYERIPSAIEA